MACYRSLILLQVAAVPFRVLANIDPLFGLSCAQLTHFQIRGEVRHAHTWVFGTWLLVSRSLGTKVLTLEVLAPFDVVFAGSGFCINPSNAEPILSSKAQWHKHLWKPSYPFHFGIRIHWIASLSTLRWVPMCQGFSHFLCFLHHFVLARWSSQQQHKG